MDTRKIQKELCSRFLVGGEPQLIDDANSSMSGVEILASALKDIRPSIIDGKPMPLYGNEI